VFWATALPNRPESAAVIIMVFIDLVISSSFESRSAFELDRAACGVGFTVRQEVTTGVNLFWKLRSVIKLKLSGEIAGESRRSAIARAVR
jgi:hypothetical protein